MDKTQARRAITEVFGQAFDRDRYERFLFSLFNSYEASDEYYEGDLIPDAYREHISQYWDIGKYADSEIRKGGSKELDLLVVQVKTVNTLVRARSMLRNFVVDRLKQIEKKASLVAFYTEEDQGADWRISFIKIENEAYKDDKGKIKTKQELTHAKRYSYLVGEHESSHTACKQLLPLMAMEENDPYIADIEKAFFVDKVTDEFFIEYKELFRNLVKCLKQQDLFKEKTDEERKKHVIRFAKKLLGQVVFLYFLQKKGWIGVPKESSWGKGNKRFMRESFDKFTENNGNYYHDFLQYLFYDALADERKNEKLSGYYPRFDCRIPFLNGGLFEEDEEWKDKDINLPNEFFHNEERTKIGDTGTGILDVFDRYNFTIKEDEPLEKEVAVDPEMLGKVFEDMLDITERKNKGTFYTPREIVHYMCQESLIYYLDNQLISHISAHESVQLQSVSSGGVREQRVVKEKDARIPNRDELEILVRKGHLALENDEKVLSNKRETDIYKFQLPESVRRHAKQIDKALNDIKVCDPAVGSGAFLVGLLHEIVNIRLALVPHSGNRQTAYELKRHAIGQNLYGVDIDNSAIDIARLRLWLSLIVDENEIECVGPLPNLDYKIVQGNSLLGIKIDLFNDVLMKKSEEKKEKYFNITDRKNKASLKEEITNIKHQITDDQDVFDFKTDFHEICYKQGGFDIVIGNPPCVQIQKFNGQEIQQNLQNQDYESFAKTSDMYYLFYEKGYRLLREQGVLAYITSNKWMRTGYGKKLRRFFSDNTQPLTLIDFSGFKVFDTATVNTSILLLRKDNRHLPVNACSVNNSFSCATSLRDFVKDNGIEVEGLSDDNWVIRGKDEYSVKKRIEQIGTPLKNWNVSIRPGIKADFNGGFIINKRKKNEIIATDKKSAEIIKPILRERDIKRYGAEFVNLFLINVHNGSKTVPPVDISKYSAVKNHLDKYLDRPIEKQDKRQTPYNLICCTYLEEFNQEKIVYPEITRNSAFLYDTSGILVSNKAFILTGKDAKYLTGLLNSQLLTYIFKTFYASGTLGHDGFHYDKAFLLELPVAPPKAPTSTYIELLVDYVQVARKNDEKLHSAFFEQLINGLVYEIYFYDEIKRADKLLTPRIGELPAITNDMAEEKKLAVIKDVFDRFYDVWHPVRNKLDTLDSVNIVRAVKKAARRR